MSRKSAVRQKTEEEILAEFAEEQRKKRLMVLKRIGVILLCVFLVIAFCLPAITVLI